MFSKNCPKPVLHKLCGRLFARSKIYVKILEVKFCFYNYQISIKHIFNRLKNYAVLLVFAGLEINAETPSETECRPYIEKALHELHTHEIPGSFKIITISSFYNSKFIQKLLNCIDGDNDDQQESDSLDTGPPVSNETDDDSKENASAEHIDQNEVASAEINDDERSSSDDNTSENGENESDEVTAENDGTDREGADSNENEVDDNAENVVDSNETASGEDVENEGSNEDDSETESKSEDNAAVADENENNSADDDDQASVEDDDSGEVEQQSASDEVAEEGVQNVDDSNEDKTDENANDDTEETVSQEGDSTAAESKESSEGTEVVDDQASDEAETEVEGDLQSDEKVDTSEDSVEAEAKIVEASSVEAGVSQESASAEHTSAETQSEEQSSKEHPSAEQSSIEDADDDKKTESDGTNATEEVSAEAEQQTVNHKESAENQPDADGASDESNENIALSNESGSFPEDDLLLVNLRRFLLISLQLLICDKYMYLQEFEIPTNLRDRSHIAEILRLDDESEAKENAINKVSDVILRELKRIYENAIKPLETLYKYRDLSNRHFSDPEIFSKPLVLFMGPWSGGKSTILNYLTENEYTPNSIRTGDND